MAPFPKNADLAYGSNDFDLVTGDHSFQPNGTVNRKKDHEAISMDDYLGSENDRLLRSHREIDDMLGQGSGLMHSFKSQGDFLKSIRTKNLDIKNTLECLRRS